MGWTLEAPLHVRAERRKPAPAEEMPVEARRLREDGGAPGHPARRIGDLLVRAAAHNDSRWCDLCALLSGDSEAAAGTS